ncbi:SAG family member [Eimeria brunetti]|uniref:SAG family member n=1 Tax=Eimeria brunetti TaxID=51314 RepID=U6LMK2_9EIME|nr:SAG family member [Eimeria brunetti]
MAVLKYLSLATAAIFVLDTSGARAMDAVTATSSAVRVDCSKAMNAARELVGFTGFTAEDKLPIKPSGTNADNDGAYLDSLCEALKANIVEPAMASESGGTYAYALQDGASADCEAAVEHWKGALSNFNGLPPAYSESVDLYSDPQNISFTSLFNPKDNPKVDCAYVTCAAKQAQPDQEEGQEDEEGGGSNLGSRNAATTDKEVKAVLCVTNPNVLTKGNPPYTQTQWDQIVTGLNKNAATGVPTFLGLAAAAVGALLL